eukprot:CAMPEP_0118927142 /NCGR_PEP_ID=MMETSP1169-20130426/4680_1 /TAXON_ID=36882 /ORGANISM="Pyramimonas obovata, Strain CCMP722" /LENGTH=390 /DNA_ID=CAMNT_0006868847 /DNA_START=315 /DNA_END=1488 /DNA_ORIENTATION=-
MKAPPQRKSSAPFAAPSSVLRAQQQALSRSRPSDVSARPTVERVSSTPEVVQTVYPSTSSLTAEVMNEYDPSRPNDYEEYRREMAKIKREKEIEEERMRRQKEREEEREREREAAQRAPVPQSRASALNVSGEEAFLRRARLSGRGPPAGGTADMRSDEMSNRRDRDYEMQEPETETTGLGATPGLGASAGGGGGGMSVAQKMMQKMGWSAGKGLGKDNQGMATPLMAKKTDGRSAVIVNASDNSGLIQREEKRPKLADVFSSNPTKVLMLRNMVGPGEVDEDLEDEVAEECSKYGEVVRVMIFEVTDPNWPAQEAVRIFVEFTKPDGAVKGMMDLDGRFFGGRVVHTMFFPEDRFERCDLAPMLMNQSAEAPEHARPWMQPVGDRAGAA